MRGKIFISYRRDDARADARSIYQHLQRTFSSDALFMDVDTIQRGRDFREVIDAYLADSAVLLVIIGANWAGTTGVGQTRRLDDPSDFVRIEIASALRSKVLVIPVLVDGAPIPREEDLPEDLKPLVYRQSARVTHENFSGDMRRIEADLRALIGPPKQIWRLVVSTVAIIVIAAGAFGLHQIYRTNGQIASRPDRPPDKPQVQPKSTPVATERAFTSFQENTDMPGSDYTSLTLAEPDAIQCQKLCSQDQRCLAWTYVAPGYQEEQAVCWLKNQVPPAARKDVCCTSGVAYYRRPAN